MNLFFLNWIREGLMDSLSKTLNEESNEKPFVHVVVRNPRTHISREKALYTDYEIVVKTNNIAFTCSESCVRRRYSDFQWLRKRLVTLYKWVTSPPELPAKRLFGRFQRQFLKRRQQGLQNFLERIVEDNQYLSDVAIHLFLQSTLPIKEIERHIDGLNGDADILDSLKVPERGRQSALSRSMTEMPLHETETCLEHDSGCCYSTTSSINDLMHASVSKTREDWRYYMSLPANLDKVNASENKESDLSAQKTQKGRLMQVDSGHLTSGSHQSLNRQHLTSESDCDFQVSDDYDADDEFDESSHDQDRNPCSLFELDKRFRLEQALDLLRTRPKASERVFSSEDSEDEFHESEYDVIESHDEKEAVETLKRRTSLHKKKIGRSLSDVKPRPKVIRSASSSSMKERSKKHSNFTSMPNIRSHSPLKSSKSFTFGRRSLTSHKEENDEIMQHYKGSVEGCSTSSSLGKCKSDDADESIVPNSEMDTWSNWNTPSKAKTFSLDSSDFDLSFENSYECQPPKTISRVLMEKLTFGRNLRSADEKPTLVGGRFRVSVIREEENSSRRGSASSCELTVRNSPLIITSSGNKPSEVSLQPVTTLTHDHLSNSSPLAVRELKFDDYESHQQSLEDADVMNGEASDLPVSGALPRSHEDLCYDSSCLHNENSRHPAVDVSCKNAVSVYTPVENANLSVKLENLTVSSERYEHESNPKSEISQAAANKTLRKNFIPTLLSLASNVVANALTGRMSNIPKQDFEISSLVELPSTTTTELSSHIATSSFLESQRVKSRSLSSLIPEPRLVTVSEFMPVSDSIESLNFGFTNEDAIATNAETSVTNICNTRATTSCKTEEFFDEFQLENGTLNENGKMDEMSLLQKEPNLSKETIQCDETNLLVDAVSSKKVEPLKKIVSTSMSNELNANHAVIDGFDHNTIPSQMSKNNEYTGIGNAFDDCLKERAGSPTSAVLTTYDVIHDVPCNVEEYEILDGKRDLLIC